MHRYLRTLIACLLLLGRTALTWGSNIVGFDESFDGTGPYATTSQNLSGLDNPNWDLLSSEPGKFDGEGYVFEHKSLPANGFGWRRNVVGNGSFRQSLKLCQLDMGWTLELPVPPIETEFAAFNLQGVRAQGSLSIIYDPARLDSDKMLDWGFGTTTGGAIHIAVPLSPDVEMGIEQDFERKVAWAWIDSPVTGRIVKGPLAFTPYEDNPFFIDVRANGAASGSASYLSGRIDHWSVEPLPDMRADINDDGVLGIADVDLLSFIIRGNGTDAVADLSIDGKVNQTDLGLWIHDHRKTYFGDANLDGQFNSQDLTLVFQAGEYEDLVDDNSGWADGDWNADGEFSSSDLVVAFQDGGYEKGPRPAVTTSVPEPSDVWIWLVGIAIAACRRKESCTREERTQKLSIRRKTAGCCLDMLLLTQNAYGSNVVGFDESFDGAGPCATESQNLTGLDNPNWRLLVDEQPGSFDGEGYVFEHRSLPPHGNAWIRYVTGNGSFRQSVKLGHLDMGWWKPFQFPPNDPEFAGVNFHGMRTQSTLSVIYDPLNPDGETFVDWGFSTDRGAVHGVLPLSQDIELGIEADFERKVAWAWIDSPATGRIIRGPLSFTPYEDNPSFIEIGFGGAATGSVSYIKGRLDNWSLEPLPDIRADINDDGVLSTADVDLLSLIIRRNDADAVADLSIDGMVDQTDLGLWIHDHRKSYFGDANLDGQFSSQDLTLVFQAGEYEELIEHNSGWDEGDWNADGEFSSSDLVVAFQDGGYERGPRPNVTSVPEPTVAFRLAIALATSFRILRVLGGQRLSNASNRPHRSDRHHGLMIVIFMLAISTSPRLFAAVQGFEESFDGNGSYSTESGNLSGLDNPGWRLDTDEGIGVLDGSGYSFAVGVYPADSDELWRDVPGLGSFREVVRVSNLDMGWYSQGGIGEGGPRSQVRLTHFFLGEPISNLVAVYFDELLSPIENNAVYWSSTHFSGIVPRMNELELGIEYDQSRKSIWYWLDSPETGRLFKGPIRIYPSDQVDFTQTALYLGKTMDGKLSGRLDNWSLEPLPDIRADINDDGVLNVADVDLMSLIIRRNGTDAVADLSIDGKVDQTDLGLWIHDHRKSYFGDANLDGQFNSQDLTLVFQAGEYEDFTEDNSGWADGDWNADGEFSSSDLVLAFQDGGYEKGPRAAEGVPEPGGVLWALGGFMGLWSRRVPRFALR